MQQAIDSIHFVELKVCRGIGFRFLIIGSVIVSRFIDYLNWFL